MALKGISHEGHVIENYAGESSDVRELKIICSFLERAPPMGYHISPLGEELHWSIVAIEWRCSNTLPHLWGHVEADVHPFDEHRDRFVIPGGAKKD
jgi:hypothetical protein